MEASMNKRTPFKQCSPCQKHSWRNQIKCVHQEWSSMDQCVRQFSCTSQLVELQAKRHPITLKGGKPVEIIAWDITSKHSYADQSAEVWVQNSGHQYDRDSVKLTQNDEEQTKCVKLEDRIAKIVDTYECDKELWTWLRSLYRVRSDAWIGYLLYIFVFYT